MHVNIGTMILYWQTIENRAIRHLAIARADDSQ
jgi:hypothetical protein